MSLPLRAPAEDPIVAANLAALAAAQPGFEARPVAQSVHCVDGVWRLRANGTSTAIHGRHPDREADRTVSELVGSTTGGLLVTVGLGLGFVLDALERRGWSGKVLAVEPQPATVPALLARRDLQPWIATGRLRLLVGPDYGGASDCSRWIGDVDDEPPVYVHPVLARVDPDAAERARTVATRILFGARENARARRQFGGRYLLNTLSNIPAIAREGDVASLAGAGRGMPAVVVAAGPSLDRNLAGLRELADRAFIIACDTALRPLLAGGIAPHLVVAVDPGEANARHLWDLPDMSATHLVAEASLDRSAFEAFRGRTFLFSVSDHQPWPWLRTHGAGRGSLRAWGSVLTSAFDLALQMGCDRIAFAGADLSFTGYRPYARGVAYEEDWRRLAAWGVPLKEQWRQQVDGWAFTEEPDVNGVAARTAPQLVAFRNWLVEQIGREPSRRIVNASGAGILHGGRVEQSSLQQLSGEWEPLKASPAHMVRARYAPANGGALLAAAERLQRDGQATIEEWIQFADGLSRPLLLRTVAEALGGTAPEQRPAIHPTARPLVRFDAEWIEPLAASLPLAALPLPPQRLEAYAPGVRRFRFRTTAARLIGCVLQMPPGAVCEDGRPLRQATEIDTVQPGEYVIWRDEIYFAASDGSDPRRNGRTYTLLVPETIACLERVPLHEVLTHNL